MMLCSLPLTTETEARLRALAPTHPRIAEALAHQPLSKDEAFIWLQPEDAALVKREIIQ